jgi:hypothetical protein
MLAGIEARTSPENGEKESFDEKNIDAVVLMKDR